MRKLTILQGLPASGKAHTHAIIWTRIRSWRAWMVSVACSSLAETCRNYIIGAYVMTIRVSNAMWLTCIA